MRLNLRLLNKAEVRGYLQRYGEKAIEGLRQVAYRVANKLVSILRVYPPERPLQRYKRTYKLQRGWKVVERSAQRGVGYSVVNEAEYRGKRYAQYVVGDNKGERQAWMHLKRWKIARQVANELLAGELNQLRRELRGIKDLH